MVDAEHSWIVVVDPLIALVAEGGGARGTGVKFFGAFLGEAVRADIGTR